LRRRSVTMSTNLSHLFLERTGRSDEIARDSLETALREVLARAGGAWPDIEIEPRIFVHHLATHLKREEEVLSALHQLHAEDLYLACAAAQHHPRALSALEKIYLSRIDEWVRRMNTSSDFSDRVREHLRERLLVCERGETPRIATYSGRGQL